MLAARAYMIQHASDPPPTIAMLQFTNWVVLLRTACAAASTPAEPMHTNMFTAGLCICCDIVQCQTLALQRDTPAPLSLLLHESQSE